MAIDASIPLGVKPSTFDPMAAAAGGMKLASMAQAIDASKAATEIDKARLGGVQADTEVKQRALRFNDWLAANKQNFTDANGKVDTQRLVAAAAGAKFNNEAQAIAANDLKMAGENIKNATDEQTRQVAIVDFTNKQLGNMSQLLSNATPEQRPALLKQYSDFSELHVPGSGQQATMAFGAPDPKTGQITVDPDKLNAVRESTMTPLQQENLALQTRQTGVSERTQALAEKTAGIPYLTEKEQIIPSGSKVEGIKAAAAGLQYVTDLDNALIAARDPELSTAITKYGSNIASKWDELVKQPGAARQLQAGMDRYNREHKDAKPLTIGDGIEAITRVLSSEKATTQKWAETHKGLATSGTAAEAAGNAGTPAAASAAKGANIRVISPRGQTGMIPAGRLSEYLKAGYKKVN